MPANAFGTTAAVGNREDLIDVIYNIAPTDTPLMSMIAHVNAESVTHEWQRDTLDTPAANATTEGADVTYAATTATQRLSNQTQTSQKSFSVTDTQKKVKKAGRRTEIDLQKLKKGRALRKDMELGLIENPTQTTGATRVGRGLRGWIQDAANNALGPGGSAPVAIGGNTAPVDGTLRTFTEAILRAGHLGCYTAGGDGDVAMMHPVMKQWVSSTMTGNGTKFIEGKGRKLEAGWDIYVGDFGQVELVPNRVMSRQREVYLLTPDKLALAVLREMKFEEGARVGPATNVWGEVEYCLECREPRAHFAIRDVQAA